MATTHNSSGVCRSSLWSFSRLDGMFVEACCPTVDVLFFGSDEKILIWWARSGRGLWRRISTECRAAAAVVVLGPLVFMDGQAWELFFLFFSQQWGKCLSMCWFGEGELVSTLWMATGSCDDTWYFVRQWIHLRSCYVGRGGLGNGRWKIVNEPVLDVTKIRRHFCDFDGDAWVRYYPI